MESQAAERTGLLRALGRWDLTALVLNGIIGSGIFGLPAIVAGLLGWWSPLAYLAAGAGIACIVLCFAELGAQFHIAGGPYIYARQAFGSFVGLEVGWVTWLVRLASAGANANLFVLYLAQFWPRATSEPFRSAVLTGLFALLAYINYRGVRQGAWASNLLVVGKLVPLGLLALVGLFAIERHTLFSWQVSQPSWGRAVLLLVFAFGGFENATFPGGEIRNARRDAPFALLTGLALVSLIYLAIQIVFLGTVAPTGATAQPLASAARAVMGAPGAWLIALGALISVWGWFAGTMLGTPRLTYALAEQGDFPRFFGRIHPRFRTPHLSILVFAVFGWLLALLGSFQWNASLSAVARLVTYGTTCAALLCLRKRALPAQAFRIPAGPVFAALGIGFCLVLLGTMSRPELLILAATMLLATAHWAYQRTRPAPSPT